MRGRTGYCSRRGWQSTVHDQALQWIAKYATADPVAVLDLGGRDINGSPRLLFPGASSYTVLDALPGPGVDIVADAATWEPVAAFDVVICAETFEHTAQWRAICRTAYAACKSGGRFIVTTAAPGRPPHSGVDGKFPLLPGEHYANIRPAELTRVLKQAGWVEVVVDVQESPHDVRAAGVKP
jgi:SAM-dependent methyltransferase